MPYIESDHECCALRCIIDFPGDEDDWEEELISEVDSYCKELRSNGRSLVMVTLNTNQKKAAQVIKRLGFKSAFNNWAYRDRTVTGISTGVKVFVKQLVPVIKSA